MGTAKGEHVVVVGAGMAGLVAARCCTIRALRHRARGAQAHRADGPWTDDSLGAPLDLAARGCMGVEAIRSRLWCDKLGVSLVESRGRSALDRRSGHGATAPRAGVAGAVMGRMAFRPAIEWRAGAQGNCALRDPVDFSVKAVDPLCTPRGCPRSTKLVIGTFVEMERRPCRARPTMPSLRGVVPTEGPWTATPAEGRVSHPARGRRPEHGDPASMPPCGASSGAGRRRDGHPGERREVEADRPLITVPLGLLRAGLPAA